MQLAGISPCDTGAFDDIDHSSEDAEDDDYSPTPIYKIVQATGLKTGDQKVTLDSNYFTYLRPLTFDSKRFHRGHPPVYTDNNIQRFDADYQKQLSFDFCATRASKKKSALINEACVSCLRNINLDIIPTTFSRDTSDRHKLSHYILEDVLTCPIGCCLIVCICAGANRNPTKRSYLDQAKQFSDKRKENNISTVTKHQSLCLVKL
jgi:hypothetical protein